MSKIDLYTIKGIKTGDLNLPKSFDEKVNMNSLAQALRVYEENAHPGLRNTKTRSEVNRTTKKVYKQKGTGGARHGSRRANLFVGGGVVFGPRPERRILSLPDKLKIKAKAMAFSYKLGKKEIVAISGFSKISKTKEPAEFIKKLGKELKAKRFTFIFSDDSLAVYKFMRNLANVNAVSYRNANAYDVFWGGEIVLDEGIFGIKNISKEEKVSKIKVEKVKKL